MKLITINKTYVVVIIIAIISIFSILAVIKAAAPSSIVFEAETTQTNQSTAVVADTTASGGSYLEFKPNPVVQPPEPAGFVHPGVVFTKAEIDSWSTSDPEYTRLASTGAGSLTSTSDRFKPYVYGTVINGPAGDITSELEGGFKDQSGFAKVQAVLWAADNNPARIDKITSYLKEYASVTSLDYDQVQQYRLTGGWACTNLAQAAEIINYQDPGFRRFLKDVCFPLLDWTTGQNWHASFADSKLAIAAYLGDEALWQEAKNYFYTRIKQSIHHSKYDSGKINPIIRTDGSVNNAATLQHWGGNWGPSQVNSDFTFNTAVGPAADGVTAERIRDYGHISMGLTAWMHGARTIKAQGESLEPQAYDRIKTAFDYHSTTVLSYAETGVFPIPVPYNGDGGGSRFQGYEGAKTLLGSDTPQSVLNILQRPEVKNRPPAGANHTVAGAYTK